MVIVIMGVSGSGKTTLGKLLAEKTGFQFADADDFHPQSNIAKMATGIPLTDEDRLPWLKRLRDLCAEKKNEGLVLACSALKQSYRQILASRTGSDMHWVYLNGDASLISERMKKRNHFMPASLLKSQFEALEPPKNAIQLEIKNPPEILVGLVVNSLNLTLTSKS